MFHDPTASPNSLTIRKSLSSEYTDRHACAQHRRRQPDPKPLPDMTLALHSPLIQETVWLELAALTHKAEALTLGLLERYWNKDCRQNMFRAVSPDLFPESAVICTNDDPPISSYEQKLVTMRLMTPELTETELPTLVVTTTSPTITHALP